MNQARPQSGFDPLQSRRIYFFLDLFDNRQGRLLRLVHRFAHIRHYKYEEQIRILVPGEGWLRPCRKRDLLIANQLAVHHAGAATSENLSRHIERQVVFIGMIRPAVGDDQNRLFLVDDADASLGVLGGLNHRHSRRRRPCCYWSKIFLGETAALLRINVARNANGDVQRHVILPEKRIRFRHAEVVDVLGEPSRRYAIGMLIKSGHQQLFHQQPLRAGFHAHPPFLTHHVAFFIEFAKDRPLKSRGFQQKP